MSWTDNSDLDLLAPTCSEPARDERRARARWGALAVACLAQLMVVLDTTIVNIALPTAQNDLGFSDDSRQWVVTAYALAFGSLLLVGGRLGDLLGGRTTLLIGLVGFATASALGGMAGSFGFLVVARVAQGMFAAMLAPASLSLVATTFTDPEERARAFGAYGATAGSGGAIGLLLGGALTEYLSWRWCLYVNIPIAVIALLGAMAVLKHDRREPGTTIDLAGAALSVAGLVCIVYGLAHAETDGWGNATTLGFIGAGLALLAVFAVVEDRVAHPMLPMSVLADRNRAGLFAAVGIAGAGMFSVFLFLAYYLSNILQYKPLKTGVAFLPMAIGIMIGAQVANYMATKIGAKAPVTGGFILAASGMALFARLGVDSSYTVDVMPGLALVGLGLGFVIAPAINGATDRVDPQHAGVASAAVNTFQQIGGSVGTSVFSALAAAASSAYLTGKDSHNTLVHVHAAIESYATVYRWGAAVFAAGAVISAAALRHRPRAGLGTPPEAPASRSQR